jgi:MFS superfamily sulfate permease-like transporter
MYDYAGMAVSRRSAGQERRRGRHPRSCRAFGIAVFCRGSTSTATACAASRPAKRCQRSRAAFLRAPRAALSTLRHDTRCGRSGRAESPEAARSLLSEHGDRAVAYEAQGDLSFCGIERLSRQIAAESPDVQSIVIDLARVTGIDATASRFLQEWLRGARASGRSFAFVAMQKFPRLLRQLEEARIQDAAIELARLRRPRRGARVERGAAARREAGRQGRK